METQNILISLEKENPFIEWSQLLRWHSINEIKKSIKKDAFEKTLRIRPIKYGQYDAYIVPTHITIYRDDAPESCAYLATEVDLMLGGTSQIKLCVSGNVCNWECRGLSQTLQCERQEFSMRKMLALIGAVILALLLNGCSDGSTMSESTKAVSTESSLQSQLDVDLSAGSSVDSKIVTDPKTGVEYIEVWVNQFRGNSVSLTPRLDKNGKPYIDPKWKNH